MRDARIILTQILPNALPPIVAVSSMMVGNAILTESVGPFWLGGCQSFELGQYDRRGRVRRCGWRGGPTVLPGLSDHGHGSGAEFHRRCTERCSQSQAGPLMADALVSIQNLTVSLP